MVDLANFHPKTNLVAKDFHGFCRILKGKSVQVGGGVLGKIRGITTFPPLKNPMRIVYIQSGVVFC